MMKNLCRECIIFFCAVFFVQCSAPKIPEPQENIFFILIDTLRPDHLGCYDYSRDTSPTIDNLAKQGILFENTIAQAPWTKPSISSIFTSTLPSTHGVTWRGRHERLPTTMTTLAEVFQQNGFRTAAFSDNPHITVSNGFGQGFDKFVENHSFLEGDAKHLTDQAIKWFKKNIHKKNFIYIHYLDPHDPYQAPGVYRDMFLDAHLVNVRKIVEMGNAYVLNGEFHLDKKMEKGGEKIPPEDYPLAVPMIISPEELQYLIDLYDGEIRYVDYQISRIIATLKALKAFDNTTLIITSDHGEEFLEHGMFRHGYQLYDETIRVPFIIVSPRLKNVPQKISVPVNLIDIMPTLLDIFGINYSANKQGRSLVQLINQHENMGSLSISETAWKGAHARSARLEDWKYIKDVRKEKEELFNLTEDPGEHNNLYPQELERAEKFSKLLLAAMEGTQLVVDKASGSRKQLQKGQLEKLRSLGYVE